MLMSSMGAVTLRLTTCTSPLAMRCGVGCMPPALIHTGSVAAVGAADAGAGPRSSSHCPPQPHAGDFRCHLLVAQRHCAVQRVGVALPVAACRAVLIVVLQPSAERREAGYGDGERDVELLLRRDKDLVKCDECASRHGQRWRQVQARELGVVGSVDLHHLAAVHVALIADGDLQREAAVCNLLHAELREVPARVRQAVTEVVAGRV